MNSEITIHLSQNLEDNTLCEGYKVSEFIDSVDYILLETTKESLMASLIQIHFTEDRIFVLETGKMGEGRLLTFDLDGRYLHQVARCGRSSGEYYSIKSAMFDEENEMIMLHCNPSNKILYYNYDGNFIKKLDLDKGTIIREIVNLPDGGFICYTPDIEARKDGPASGLWKIDSLGGYVRNYIDVRKGDEDYIYSAKTTSSLYDILPNGDIIVMDGFRNDLYYYDLSRDSLINYIDYVISDFNLMRCTKENASKGIRESYTKLSTVQTKGDFIYHQWMNPSISSIYHVPTNSFISVSGTNFNYDLPLVRYSMTMNNLPNALIMAPSGSAFNRYLNDESVPSELRSKIREQFGAMSDQQIAESNPLIQIMYVR